MSLTPACAARRTLIAAGVIAYPVLAYYSTTPEAVNTVPALGLTISLTPVLALLTWLAWRSPRRVAMLALCVAVGCLLWRYRDTLEGNVGWVYFIQHAGTYVLLGAVFGMTLMRGRHPLCTRCAQALRGHLSPEVARYTRYVTLAWTLFFLGISLMSTLLFFFCSMDVWSVFANFLTLPLMALMFVAEHLVRLRKLPYLERHTIMDSIRAFRNIPEASPGVSLRPR
ncbi:hypothetical protein [uncultured Lamprocystis sp.]|jgi:uncharacterized membrane protein|uniref:COG4648 family protein n=1 Tax=uncultured Lamprocystis sp. TaxID=543132 RepID=UPI0025E4EF15|nr:hypothetical protein [uncultured Lamprocystis sp.]